MSLYSILTASFIYISILEQTKRSPSRPLCEGDGRWAMRDGRWVMGDGRWGIRNRKQGKAEGSGGV